NVDSVAAPVSEPPQTAATAQPAGPNGGLLRRIFGALGDNRHYRSYWYGNQANTMLMQMQMVANGYLAFTLTGSATDLGVVAFAQSLPMLLFSPVGGVLADRSQKRKLLLWIQALQCASSVIIGVRSTLDRIASRHLAG